MKNWKIMLALFVFFPLGIYLMFKESTWSKRTKYIVTAAFSLLTLIVVAIDMMIETLFISGNLLLFSGFVILAYSFIRKKDFKPAIALLFMGMLLTGFTYTPVEVRSQERLAVEQQLLAEEEARIEAERQKEILGVATTAVEKAEADPNRSNYKTALSLVSDLEQENTELLDRLKQIDNQLTHEEKLEEMLVLVERAEKNPNRADYEKALTFVNDLDENNQDLQERLAAVEKTVSEYEKITAEANAALATAEETLARSDYDKAKALVTSLPKQDSGLTKRLGAVEENIVKEEKRIAEETKKAEEKAQQEEAERIAKEKAEQEEAARIAAEEEAARIAEAEAEAARVAEQERIAAEEAAAAAVVVEEAPAEETDDAAYYGEALIKGSQSGIYHVPGSTYYDRTTNVAQWFYTVEEAEAAGYRAPKR